MAIRYLNYSGLTRDSIRIHHFANQFQPWKVMRSLVAVLFLAGAAEVVDTYSKLTVTHVQQAANVRFDHFDFFSFLPLKAIL